MSYAGVDLSTHAVDVVYLEDDGRATHEHYPLTGPDAFERTRSVRDAMPARGHWRDCGVIAVGIEEPQGASRVAVAKLKAIQGAILACLPRELLVEPLVPARWRALCGLPGNASKDDVANFARYRTGNPYSIPPFSGSGLPSYDACDAYCLALAVSRLTQEEMAA